MIRIITRNFNTKKLTEEKWDGHFAFFHFKKFKNIYLNGKPLKPWNILKNGDVIEIILQPKKQIVSFATSLLTIAANVFLGEGLGAIVGLVVGIVGTTASSLLSKNTLATPQSATQKEYSSSTQPELKGANNEISDGCLPVVFGKTQQTPSYGQLPYRLVLDGASTNKYRQYFVSNYNNVTYSDFKLGETPRTDYSIDYIDIITASGSSNFIGFDNVKAVTINEELSYNPDEDVNQNAHFDYNDLTNTNFITLNFQLKFTNVALNNWANKTFISLIRVVKDGAFEDLTQNITITKAELENQGNDTYIYNGTVTHTIDEGQFSEVVYTNFAPESNTRGNSVETTNELDVLYVSENLVTETLNLNTVLNLSVNKYSGTVSECIATSPDGALECDVIISFPQGLYHQNNSGTRGKRSVKVEIMFKEGDGEYRPVSEAQSLYIRDLEGNKQPLSSSTTTIDGANVTMETPSNLNVADQLFFRPIGFVLPSKGKYTVRVRSADFADKSNYDIGYPYCAEIQFYMDGSILDTSILPKVNQIAFEATAYKGLSGTLKKFNYIAEARIPVWNGENWDTIAPSENPAAIIRYLLCDTLANPRPISPDLIDNNSLVKLYDWCEEQGYKAGGIVSEATKTFDVINEILSNCQGGMIPLLNGKHVFTIDGGEKTPKGMFNQHNSWDFSWTPNIGRLTEALRVSFVDNTNYTEDEVTVWWYDGAVHESIKEGTTEADYLLVKKEMKYVNDRQSVLKALTYELETIQTRRNNFEFSVNLEALNMTLLDRVFVSNSANMQNESTGLIKKVLSKNDTITGFELYAAVEIPEDAKIIIRSLDYANETAVINIYDVLNSGRTHIVEIEPVLNDGIIKGAGEIQGIKDVWHYDGDLFTIGQDTIYDCVITDIRYNEDNTATITCRDY